MSTVQLSIFINFQIIDNLLYCNNVVGIYN